MLTFDDIAGRYQEVLATSYEGEGKQLRHRLFIDERGNVTRYFVIVKCPGRNERVCFRGDNLTEAILAYNTL